MKVHGLPGLCLIGFSTGLGVINNISPSNILTYVQIFSYLAAGIYYLEKFLSRDHRP